MAEDDGYTKDGTIDYKRNPANRKKTGTWKACCFVLGYIFCEKFAYYGMNLNLEVYFKDRLNQHKATASKNVSNWSNTCSITPLIGAFVADAYLGRYWTIAVFSIIYVMGMSLLTLSASVPGISPTCHGKDNCHETDWQSVICFVGLYLIALGAGAIESCALSYGADQFDDADETEKKQKNSFFNWYYFSIIVGALTGVLLLGTIKQYMGWGWGFGISAVTMAITVISFFSGTRIYRNQKPGGSPLTRICQVVVASFKKFHVKLPEDKTELYERPGTESVIQGSRKLEHTNNLSFFDKAAVETQFDKEKDSPDPWRLCTVTQVEELKAVVRLLPVLATVIIFATVYSQMTALFVLQGATMDASIGPSFDIPSDYLTIFSTLSVIFWIPVYVRLIVPLANKFTGHKTGLTQLQRMGIGLVISIFAILAAGILELIRLGIVRNNNYYDRPQIPLSIFWQFPQYFLTGCAAVFTLIGQFEFFYEQAPDAMRSTSSALSVATVALGYYPSLLLVAIVTSVSTKGGNVGWIPDNLNYGHLDYFFWLLAVLSVLNLGAFLFVAKWYIYKKPINASQRNSIYHDAERND